MNDDSDSDSGPSEQRNESLVDAQRRKKQKGHDYIRQRELTMARRATLMRRLLDADIPACKRNVAHFLSKGHLRIVAKGGVWWRRNNENRAVVVPSEEAQCDPDASTHTNIFLTIDVFAEHEHPFQVTVCTLPYSVHEALYNWFLRLGHLGEFTTPRSASEADHACCCTAREGAGSPTSAGQLHGQHAASEAAGTCLASVLMAEHVTECTLSHNKPGDAEEGYSIALNEQEQEQKDPGAIARPRKPFISAPPVIDSEHNDPRYHAWRKARR